MNTYGLHSINIQTFNLKMDSPLIYPQQVRNALLTFFKVHNLTLNILGYIPGVSRISGCVRMGTGLLICTVVLAIGERDAQQGAIIGHWYDEALLTGIAQIARGALEAFAPFGRMANLSFDIVATVLNVGKELTSPAKYSDTFIGALPYPDPKYPFPFWLLHLA